MRRRKAVHHATEIDEIALDLSRAVLETVEVQKRLDQTTQTTRLERDGVEMLLICFEDAILDGFDRGLNGHERRTQLMGYVADELTLEVAVALDGVCHLIETLAELTELIIAAKPRTGGEVAFLDCRGGICDAADGTRDADGEVEAENDGEHEGDGPEMSTAAKISSSLGAPA